jgi:hypothetical protein
MLGSSLDHFHGVVQTLFRPTRNLQGANFCKTRKQVIQHGNTVPGGQTVLGLAMSRASYGAVNQSRY